MGVVRGRRDRYIASGCGEGSERLVASGCGEGSER